MQGRLSIKAAVLRHQSHTYTLNPDTNTSPTMASKRHSDTLSTQAPPAKRNLLNELVDSLDIDEGDYGPPEPIDLDALCNQAYNYHFGHTDTSESTHKSTHLYPKEIDFKDFPLTRNGSKTIRIGVDITDFSPYILLMGESNTKSNRLWLRFSFEEFKLFTSVDYISQLLTAMRKQQPLTNDILGGIKLSIQPGGKNRVATVCVQRTDSPVKIYLGESSLKMMVRANYLMEVKLTNTHTLCLTAQQHWLDTLQLAKRFCEQQGYTALSESEITSAFQTIFTPFPYSFKTEMICYHFSLVREKLMALMTKL